MSRLLHFAYDVRLDFSRPVTQHVFVLRCIPASFPGQQILDWTLALDPLVCCTQQQDGFGNVLHLGRIDGSHDHFRYHLTGTARVDTSQRRKEPGNPLFAFPSAYTQPWPGLSEALERLRLPDNPREKAWQLAQFLHSHMTYVPGSTGLKTTAQEAFAARQGVCQDYAHIYLALARQAGLTARYVNGLPQGEGVSHAWCEVWLDGVWTGIDPTRQQWTDDGYLRFGIGRDFADCPMERGVFLGAADQTQTVFMQVWAQ